MGRLLCWTVLDVVSLPSAALLRACLSAIPRARLGFLGPDELELLMDHSPGVQELLKPFELGTLEGFHLGGQFFLLLLRQLVLKLFAEMEKA